MSYSLLEVERGIRRIAGHYDLGALLKALERPSESAGEPSEAMAVQPPTIRAAGVLSFRLRLQERTRAKTL